MATKPKKYLIDTSAVRPAMGHSTPSHLKHFADQVGDGSLWTSVYIRMEFIRRWFCTAASLAFAISHFDDVSAALVYLEQDFRQRENKAILASVAAHLKLVGPLKSGREAAEECAGLALRWLKLFDATFPRRTRNSCCCQIGGKQPNIDYNTLLMDLQSFYVEFKTSIMNCEVNDFLDLTNAKGRSALLLRNAEIGATGAGKNLLNLRERQVHVTCDECGTIGDAIIALEQPGSWCLVHTDDSFNVLCQILDREHKQVQSVRSFDKDLYRRLNPRPH